VAQEIFGPVLCGRSVASEEEAIELANDSDFGLVATVDQRRQRTRPTIGREMQAGSIWFNSEQNCAVRDRLGRLQAQRYRPRARALGACSYLEVKHIIRPCFLSLMEQTAARCR